MKWWERRRAPGLPTAITNGLGLGLPALDVAQVIAKYFDDGCSVRPQVRQGTPLELDDRARIDAIERVGGWSAEIDALLLHDPQTQLPDITQRNGRIVPR